ncbi:MAG: hypothetical protein QOE82_3196 [Thermoanaerobaculia bacterium]|nr:hypothetical protein [Thermoanaerobaculia bacterium]
MRTTIRTYALISLVVAALAMPASAMTTTGSEPDDFLARLKNFVVRALDEAKLIWPTP